MHFILFLLFLAAGLAFFWRFAKTSRPHNPLWLMLAAWMLALGVPQLHLSKLELPWPPVFWLLVAVSLICFAAGCWLAQLAFARYPIWNKIAWLQKNGISLLSLRAVVYALVALSAIALKMFYVRAGNFPLLAPDPDIFRFAADQAVPGLINYGAQLARLYIPLAFLIIFLQTFSWKKHWDLVLVVLGGTISLALFASRTQVYMVDLLVMALYLFIRKPNLKQALKFYPVFLLISIIVLAAIPLFRQNKTYSKDYLTGLTQINTSRLPKGSSYLVPIYVGISFNMQALLHADRYYTAHPLQHGKVSLDIFTNLLRLPQYRSHYDLGQIFEPWWNTGTYLFPFVQDFGRAAFFIIPAIFGFLLTMVWRFWRSQPMNFLALIYYAYAGFFITMTVYLSFTIRAEMYIDLFLLLLIYFLVARKDPNIT